MLHLFTRDSHDQLVLRRVFRRSARIFRRLKILSSPQQQNQNFVHFESEARKAENKCPPSSRRISRLHVGSFAGGFLLLLFRGSLSAFHPLLAFLILLAAVQQRNSAESHPYTVKTQQLPQCPTLFNKTLQSPKTLRSLMSRGLNNVTLIERMTSLQQIKPLQFWTCSCDPTLPLSIVEV